MLLAIHYTWDGLSQDKDFSGKRRLSWEQMDDASSFCYTSGNSATTTVAAQAATCHLCRFVYNMKQTIIICFIFV